MNKTMLITINEGLVQIMSGLQTIQSVITTAVQEGKEEANAETSIKNVPVEETTEEVETVTGHHDKADLEAMSYNEIKKLAKDSGVSAKGSKDAIIERLLAIEVEVEAPTAEEIAEAEVEDQQEEVVEETTEEEETEDNTEVVEEEEDIQAMVERETADMSLEEIAEVLAEIGKSTKGKRQSLIARLVEAVEEGLISFDDEEAEEEEEVEEQEETTAPESEEEDEEESDEEVEDEEEEEESLEDDLEEFYAQMDRDEAKALVKALGGKILKKDTVETLLDKVRQYDAETIVDKLKEIGLIEDDEEEVEEEEETTEVVDVEEEDYFNEANMTTARKEAIAKAKKEVLADIKSGEISMKDIENTLTDFYLPHEGYEKSLPKQEKIDMFVEAYLRLLDDEGEENEFESPYYIDEKPACCGHFLKDADGSYYCEVCGTEYDNE